MVALDFKGQNQQKQICQSKLTETNSIIIKEYIDRKYTFYAGREYLTANFFPTEVFLEVKQLFYGQMDGCIGFGTSKSIRRDV